MSQGEGRSGAGTFSGMDAAFEGFRITREHPFAVLIWSAIFLVFTAASSLVMAALSGPALQEFTQVAMTGGGVSAQHWAALAPGYLASLAISLVLYAFIANAVARASESGSGGGFGFIRLGGREVLQFVNLLLWGLIVTLVYLASAIAAIILGVVLAMLAGMLSPMLAGAVTMAVPVVVLLLALLLISARLCLAGPITAYEGGIGIGRSWSMTKGRTWSLVGALFIAMVFAIIVCVLVGVIGAAILSTMTGGFDQVWPAIVAATQSPGEPSAFWIVYMVFASLMSGLSSAIVFGVGPYAYRHLKGASAARAI